MSRNYDASVAPMIKKYYILAIVSLLTIPVVTMVGATIAILIDPEIAVHSANYERNFRLLNQLKLGLLLAAFAVDIGLWILACFFLLKSKKQSYWWLPLCVLGPFGLIALTIVRDNDPLPGDLYQRFIRSMKSAWRVAYEVGLFALVWIGAFLSVALLGEIRIIAESALHRYAEGANRRRATCIEWNVGVHRRPGDPGAGGSFLPDFSRAVQRCWPSLFSQIRPAPLNWSFPYQSARHHRPITKQSAADQNSQDRSCDVHREMTKVRVKPRCRRSLGVLLIVNNERTDEKQIQK